MISFSWGALAATCAIAGLFFLKFWRTSGDRLFLFFAAAFWLMGLQWSGLAAVSTGLERPHELYLLRLLGFVTLIGGVLDKNARTARAATERGSQRSRHLPPTI
jgi:hypothetical protein